MRLAKYKDILVGLLFAFLSSEVLSDAAPIAFQNKSLLVLIKQYEEMGYSFLYSSDLVHAHQIIHQNIVLNDVQASEHAISKFKEMLREFNLDLYPSKKDRQWLIVKNKTQYLWIRGQTREKLADLPIVNAKISTDQGHTYSNEQGEFQLLISQQDEQLIVTHPYYLPRSTPISPDSINTIFLTSERLEEMVINASWYFFRHADHYSTYDISADELAELPVQGRDAFRAVSYLPGVSFDGLSAQNHIRGGLRDETLVLFNDIELLDPFHLRDFKSLVSGLNPSLIESIDVYTGGFPARYGDKMSGVIDIDPIRDIDHAGTEIYSSFLSSGASAYGNINDGHWIISARRGNLDLVENYVDSLNGDPSYSDAFTQVFLPLGENASLDTGLLAYNDNIVVDKLEILEDMETVEGEYAKSRYNNTYGWLQLQNETRHAFYSTTLSYGAIRHQRNGMIIEEDETTAFINDARDIRITALSHRNEFSLGKYITVELGGKFNNYESEYEVESELERGDLAELLALPLEINTNVNKELTGKTGGLHTSLQYTINPAWSIETGLRWDFQDIDGKHFEDQISPRISSVYSFRKKMRLRASFGRFHQPDSFNDLQISDGISEFQEAQRTDSIILGLDYDFLPSTSIRIETFKKNIDNPKFRYENIFNSLEIIPELMDDRILVAPEKARSYGAEFSISYHPSDAFKSWLSYSFARAEDYINGQWQPRIWQQDKSIVGGIIWKPGNWTISQLVRWHSGWKTTSLPREIDELTLENIPYNQNELPDFFSLDFKINHDWYGKKHQFSLFLEVTNLTNHKNIGGIEYDVEENDDERYTISPEDEELLSIVPSLGFEWKY